MRSLPTSTLLLPRNEISHASTGSIAGGGVGRRYRAAKWCLAGLPRWIVPSVCRISRKMLQDFRRLPWLECLPCDSGYFGYPFFGIIVFSYAAIVLMATAEQDLLDLFSRARR